MAQSNLRSISGGSVPQEGADLFVSEEQHVIMDAGDVTAANGVLKESVPKLKKITFFLFL